MVLILCGCLLSQLASSGDRCTLKAVKSILDACSHLTSNYIRTNYEPYLPNLVYQRGSWQIIVPVLLRKTSSGILHLKSVPYLIPPPMALLNGLSSHSSKEWQSSLTEILEIRYHVSWLIIEQLHSPLLGGGCPAELLLTSCTLD